MDRQSGSGEAKAGSLETLCTTSTSMRFYLHAPPLGGLRARGERACDPGFASSQARIVRSFPGMADPRPRRGPHAQGAAGEAVTHPTRPVRRACRRRGRLSRHVRRFRLAAGRTRHELPVRFLLWIVEPDVQVGRRNEMHVPLRERYLDAMLLEFVPDP